MICPKCGGPVPEDTIWVRQNKFYCSQECAQEGPIIALSIRPR